MTTEEKDLKLARIAVLSGAHTSDDCLKLVRELHLGWEDGDNLDLLETAALAGAKGAHNLHKWARQMTRELRADAELRAEVEATNKKRTKAARAKIIRADTAEEAPAD